MPRVSCLATLFFSCVTKPFTFNKLEVGEANDTRLLILRNLLQTYERKNRTTRCMPASYVQNHVQKFEGRVRRRPLHAGLRSSPSRIQDSIRELPDSNTSRQVDAMRVGPVACARRDGERIRASPRMQTSGRAKRNNEEGRG